MLSEVELIIVRSEPKTSKLLLEESETILKSQTSGVKASECDMNVSPAMLKHGLVDPEQSGGVSDKRQGVLKQS